MILIYVCLFSLKLSGKGHLTTFIHRTRGDAQHAVDGNRDSDYLKGSCTHLALKLSLTHGGESTSEMSSFNKVIITNRGVCCEEKIVGAQNCTGCLCNGCMPVRAVCKTSLPSPTQLSVNMLGYSTLWTASFFGNECLWLTLLVKGVNDCLLDNCQISSLPHDCVA